MIIRFQIGDISLRFGEMGEKVGKSRNFGTPKILTTFRYSFSGPIARKSEPHTHAPDPKGVKKILPQNFFAGGVSSWGI